MEKIKSLLSTETLTSCVSALVVFLAGALFVVIVTAPIEPDDYTVAPWPTPYPSGAGITEERCEEYRYSDEAILTIFEGWWNSETGEYADDYELTKFLNTAAGYSVASHNCSLYDPSFDDDHFYWSQRAYFIIDILETRFYEERYLAPDPTPTPSAQDKENCELWRFEFDYDLEPAIVESNAGMAALTLKHAYGVYNANKCAEIDASFKEDTHLYFLDMFETLEILTSWLIQEEADG